MPTSMARVRRRGVYGCILPANIFNTHVRLQAKLQSCSPLAQCLVTGNIMPYPANHPKVETGAADN